MYKLIEIKQGIGGLYITKNYMYYTLESKKYQLYVCDSKNASDIIFISEEERVNYYEMYGDNLIYISRNEEYTYLVNLKTKVKNHIKKVLYDLVDNYYQENENFYDDKDKNIIYIYDLMSGNIKKKINKTLVGYPKLNTNNYVITTEDTHIYTYQKSDFSLLWQKDISEITQYTEWDNSEVKGEIREIYSYKDSIIVLTQVFVLRINPHTGEIIYSLRLPAGLMTLSIENQKAYGCYGYHYMEIDLEKGTLINFIRIEEAIYEGKSYNATMNKATFHNGYVFHGLRLEGGQYAVGAINTQTSKREWISLLKTNMVEKIQFHQDKMFISDSGGNLFIYEKI